MSKPQQRATETRARLIRATIDSLVERGYSGTSTYEVCARANAPRGTLLYHFSTRDHLLTAALEEIVTRQMFDFLAAVDAVPAKERTVRRIVELLWEQFSSPTNHAWIELILGSRTSPGLREAVKPMMERLGRTLEEVFASVFPPPSDRPETVAAHAFAPHFATMLLNGLSLARIYEGDRHVENVIDAMTATGEFLVRSKAKKES